MPIAKCAESTVSTHRSSASTPGTHVEEPSLASSSRDWSMMIRVDRSGSNGRFAASRRFRQRSAGSAKSSSAHAANSDAAAQWCSATSTAPHSATTIPSVGKWRTDLGAVFTFIRRRRSRRSDEGLLADPLSVFPSTRRCRRSLVFSGTSTAPPASMGPGHLAAAIRISFETASIADSTHSRNAARNIDRRQRVPEGVLLRFGQFRRPRAATAVDLPARRSHPRGQRLSHQIGSLRKMLKHPAAEYLGRDRAAISVETRRGLLIRD